MSTGSIKHVAIIMDGNGRWANERRRPRVWGHVRGSKKVTDIATSASKLGLESLTLYAFSTENWSRPSEEVKTIFKLLKKFLKKERQTILENNIQFNVIGNYKVLDSHVVNLIEEIKETSAINDGLRLTLGINYGGRAEIVDAVNTIIKTKDVKEITETDISKNLYDSKVTDIDLMIRTSGDQRISNFLTWQMSYSELYFTNTKWPDFSANEFESIIYDVAKRERRFGSTSKNESLESVQSKANKNLKELS